MCHARTPHLLVALAIVAVTSMAAQTGLHTGPAPAAAAEPQPEPAYPAPSEPEPAEPAPTQPTEAEPTPPQPTDVPVTAEPATGGGIQWQLLQSAAGEVPVAGPPEQTLALVLDVDGDGLNDFVIGGRKAAPAMTWFRRTANGWDRFVIDAGRLPIEAGGAAYDVDGDGDTDVIAGEDYTGNRLYWWENPAPELSPDTPWQRHVIKAGGAPKHHDQIVGDFDGDGRAELVFWNQGDGSRGSTLWRATIPASPRTTSPWPLTRIYTAARQSEGLAAADVDGDGVTDIVGGGFWFQRRPDRSFAARAIDSARPFTRVAVGQLIPGGRPEVVFVAGDERGPARWYRWDGQRWVGQALLPGDVRNGHSLAIADMNADGHLDVFSAEMRIGGQNPDSRMWILLGDGAGHFAATSVGTGYANHESRVADLDGDGDMDILGKPYNYGTPGVNIWLNQAPAAQQPQPLDRWQRVVVDNARPWQAVFITGADIDGDGRRDIVTGAWWYRNAGPGAAWERRTIGAPLNNMAAVLDVDGDGDQDVVGTEGKGSSSNGRLVWAQNDGAGGFTVRTGIAAGAGDFLQGVAAAQLEQGRGVELALSWHADGKGVQALEIPADPAAASWPLRQLAPNSQDEALSAGDIDRDGDTDLLQGTRWLRNDGGSWTQLTLSSAGGAPDRSRLADVNGDGRLDAVVGFEAVSAPGPLVWYEQGEDPAAPWAEHVIATVTGPMSLDVGDLDGDGDLDVAVGEHNLRQPSAARLMIFENIDGGASWTPHVVSTGDEHHDGAQLVDIDGDGDLDIISIGWGHGRVLLYENQAPLQQPAELLVPVLFAPLLAGS